MSCIIRDHLYMISGIMDACYIMFIALCSVDVPVFVL